VRHEVIVRHVSLIPIAIISAQSVWSVRLLADVFVRQNGAHGVVLIVRQPGTEVAK